VGNRLVEEARAEAEEQYEQLELFTDTGGQEEEKKQEELRLEKGDAACRRQCFP